MKKLLVLLSLFGGMIPAFAISVSAPSSVTSGTAYTVNASHNHYLNPPTGFSVIILKNGAQVAGNGGGGSGSVTVNTTYNTTDTGNQTITYTGSATVYSTTYTASAQTQIIVPNQAPTISWVQNPASANTNQTFAIQALGHDNDGNLTNVRVWVNGSPFAFNGGGNGYDGYSDANGYSSGTPGTVTFSAQAQDSTGATSATIYHTVTINAVNGVTFNSTNWPASATPGQGLGFYYNITNSGTKTWGANHYIGLTDIYWAGLSFPSVNGWTPGTTGNVNFAFTAPSAPGNYTYYIRGLENNVEWFGPTITKTLTVTNNPPDSPFIAATVNGVSKGNNGSMNLNESIVLTATLHDSDNNLTQHTLYYQKTLGAAPDPAGWTALTNDTATNGTNSSKTVTFTPLTSGRYDFHTNGWDGSGTTTASGGYSITIYVYGWTNNATFQGYNVAPPSSMTTGESYSVSLTMLNSGDKPWNTDATPHSLGSTNPYDNGTWGFGRVGLGGGVTVVPGATKTFSFTVTAPTTPGTRNFQWRMVEDGVEWFGDFSTNASISVTDNDAPSVPTGLVGTSITPTSFTLNWNASSDNAGVYDYEIERQGAGTVTSATTSYAFSGLAAYTTYQLRVRARDAANNWSGWSSWQGVTTALDPVADNDNDGIPNGWEQSNGLNPLSAADAQLDPDNDGMTSIAEYNLSNNPQSYNQGSSNLGNSVAGGWPNGWINPSVAVGATAGELSVDKSGGATYSIPIWTTPGTAGMQPQVSLNYSSQAGAGIAGFGWSLSGVSTITRGPKTIAVDGVARGVAFDAQDQFYLDGQRLILVSGTHGVAGATYRTELESFTRVTALGSRGTGPAAFKAQTKAGLTIWFGNSDGSTNDASTFDAYGRTEPFSWSVSKIQDTKGNYMAFVYEEIVNSTEGSQRLTRINYTGNGGVSPYASLRLEYEDRTDWARGWSMGAPVSNLKRLKTIKSYYGESVARTYTLNYTARGTANARNLLTSLTEAGSDGKAYPDLNFEYEDPVGGWELQSFYTPAALAHLDPNIQQGTGLMDLNGDGYADFVRKKVGNSGVISDNAWLNTPSGWTGTTPDYRIIGSAIGIAYDGRRDPGTRMVDLNGDGLVDVLFSLLPNSGTVANAVNINNGSGWSSGAAWTLPTNSGYPANTVYVGRENGDDMGRRLLDINGDGLPDLVWNFDNSEKGCLINNIDGRYQSGGPAWVRADAWMPPIPISGNVSSGSDFFDVNGDGLPDQIQHGISNGIEAGVAINSGTGWVSWNRVNVGSGTAFATYKASLGAVGKYLPPVFLRKDGSGYRSSPIGTEIVDVNGDGLVDVITNNAVLAGSTAQLARQAWLNTGDGWVSSTDYAPPVGVYLMGRSGGNDTDPTGAGVIDLNGDGLPDLAVHRSDQTSSRVYYLNTGRGWGAVNTSYLTSTDLSLPHPLAHGTATAPAGTQPTDINGDGMVDSVFSDNTQPSLQPYRNKAKPTADRLKKVTNGLGVAASISYALLTERDGSGNPTIYTKGAIGSGPTGSVNVTGPMVVVSAINNDDGVGGQYPVSYKYAGLRSHRLRGSLGFEKTTVTDGRTSIRTETTYSQTFPFTGMPVLSETISGSVTLKKSEVLSYQDKLFNSGKTHFVFAQDSKETTKDLNGAALSVSQTTIPVTPSTEIDAYGNVTKIVVVTDGFTRTTTSTFTNDDTTTNWLLGRLTGATVTTSAAGYTTQTRTSNFTYDPTSGLLLTEKVEPGSPTLELTTTYTYDAFGNKNSVTTSGSGLTVDNNGTYTASGTVSRTTTTQYDTNGRFPSWTKNAVNHQEDYTTYDPVLGVLTGMTGANGLASSWSYDGFGRKTQENRPDGTTAYTTYRWVASAPAQAKYYTTAPTAKYHVETQVVAGATNIAPPALAFYDAFGRSFLALSVNGDGNIVYQTSHYDNMGRAFATSVPYLSSGTAYWTRTSSFDLLNRPLTTVTPDDVNGDQFTTYVYNGLTVSVTDPKSRVAETVKNGQGWTITNTRNALAASLTPASTVTYGYDVLGNLTSTVADGVTTTIGYDVRGRKTSMVDADMGTWQYRYNVFGELIWQKDAKSQIVTMAYDSLGRMTSRVEAEGTTNWTYDSSSAGGAWKGKLYQVTAPATGAASAYAETYLYDSAGRPTSLTRTIDGVSYQTQTTYDSASRPSRTIYPTGVSGNFSTRNVYNAFGFLKEVRNYIASDDGKPNHQLQGKIYWMADSYAVTGQINGELYGNGLANDRYFSAVTGRLTAATIDRGAVISGPYFVQNLSYSYDKVGNVNRRYEQATGYVRDEQFYNSTAGDGYDGLDRLLVHKVIGGATVSVAYDAKGNITSKSDVGSYTYTGYGPHAVGSAGANSYGYDGNGNMTSGAGRTLTWTSFNQMKSVTQSGKTAEFSFGAGHERVLQVRKTGATITDRTTYVGALYERILTAGGDIEHKHYIMGPTGRIAVFTERSNLSKDTRWFHTDGLGSITVVSDENGRVLKRYAYDAWGKQSTLYTNTGAGIVNQAPTTRGFTDHEMLNDFGLIHMNGRVYDSALGRFISADPNVDGVHDGQGYNRYSYVGNNPTGTTDPTGYFKLKEILPAIIGIVVTAVAIVVFGPSGVYAAKGFWAAFQAGLGASYSIGAAAVGGFASSFSGSLLNGGSIGDALKAGVIGAAVGAATAWASVQIGQVFGADNGTFAQWGGRTLSHATVGGLASEAQGGSFRHGFYSSAASAGIMHIKGVSAFMGGTKGGAWVAARTVAAAAIGGTASALGGGKFANGATTSAFQQLFNAEATAKYRERIVRLITEKGNQEFIDSANGIKNYIESRYWSWNIKAEVVLVSNAAELEAAMKGADAYSALFHHRIDDASDPLRWSNDVILGADDLISNTQMQEWENDSKRNFTYYTCGKDAVGQLVQFPLNDGSQPWKVMAANQAKDLATLNYKEGRK